MPEENPKETTDIAQQPADEATSVAGGASKGETIASEGAKVDADVTDALDEGTTAVRKVVKNVAGTVVKNLTADGAEELTTEAAGAALDATGVLAPLGVLLQIGGAIFGGVETAKSIVDASSATSDENAQNALAEQKNAIQKNIANQRFVGANVTPGLSSTTANAVTSGAF